MTDIEGSMRLVLYGDLMRRGYLLLTLCDPWNVMWLEKAVHRPYKVRCAVDPVLLGDDPALGVD